MTEFREVKDDADKQRILNLLVPCPLAIGQRVWWHGLWGEIFEGQVRRIEIGYATDNHYRWEAWNIVCQAHLKTDSRGEGKVRSAIHDWESETYSVKKIEGYHSLYRFQTNPEKVITRARESLGWRASELEREAAKFRDAALKLDSTLEFPLNSK